MPGQQWWSSGAFSRGKPVAPLTANSTAAVAAVDGDRGACHVASTVRHEEHHNVCDLGDGGGSWVIRHQFLPTVWIMPFGARLFAQDVGHAVGDGQTGVYTQHPNPVAERRRTNGLAETNQRTIASCSSDVSGTWSICCRAYHIQDHARTVGLKVGEQQSGQVDVTKHLEVPCLSPGVLVDRVQRPAGDCAGIVDDNVEGARQRYFGQAGLFVGLGKVTRHGGYVDAMSFANLVGRSIQVHLRARRQDQVNTFGGQGVGYT